MALTPKNASDSLIERMFEGDLAIARAAKVALDRLDEVMHLPPDIDLTARRYDIDVSMVESAPADERWQAIDLNTYDGSPEGCGGFVGRGASQKEARMALLEQFAEYDRPDNEPAPRAGIMVNSSPAEPPDFIAHKPVWRDGDDD